jgi:hypothetical protein
LNEPSRATSIDSRSPSRTRKMSFPVFLSRFHTHREENEKKIYREKLVQRRADGVAADDDDT